MTRLLNIRWLELTPIHIYDWIITSVHTSTYVSMHPESDTLALGLVECMTYVQPATKGRQDAMFHMSVTTISIGWVLGDHRSSCVQGRATGTLTMYLFDLSSSFRTCRPTKLIPPVSRMRGLAALGGGGGGGAVASAVSAAASSADSPSGTLGSSSAMFPADATRPAMLLCQREREREREREGGSACARFHVNRTCA